jgi:hypothetical protein
LPESKQCETGTYFLMGESWGHTSDCRSASLFPVCFHFLWRWGWKLRPGRHSTTGAFVWTDGHTVFTHLPDIPLFQSVRSRLSQFTYKFLCEHVCRGNYFKVWFCPSLVCSLHVCLYVVCECVTVVHTACRSMLPHGQRRCV